MEASCVRQTELPNTTRLFGDYMYHSDRVARFYRSGTLPPHFPAERRAGLVAALAELNPGNPSLELLARAGTVAVVTGQQVGLFSGPAYTLYKALTAVRLARQLSESGTPAVPVFWLATEDHDFAEVNHAWVFGPDAVPVRLEVNGHTQPEQPVGSTAIDTWNADELRRVLDPFPFGEEVGELVRQAYAPGRTMGDAFRRLLQALLGRFGLLFIDPLSPSIRRLAAPLLRDAVMAGPELNRRLLERNQELITAGYHTQVHVEPTTSLVFLLERERRLALKRQNGSYLARDRKFSEADLAEMAERLSPNALLRPVVQDFLMPTAVYVGGPAELAYFAQSQVIYDALLGGMPRLVSRAGFTLLDRRSAKLMDRYGLSLGDFFHGEEPLRERVAARLVPPEVSERFAAVNTGVQTLLDSLVSTIGGFDPTLAEAAGKSRSKMLYQLRKIETKVGRESLRRNERAGAEAAYLYNTVFPHRHLQERFYSAVPFLARHGLELIDQLADNVHLECPDHIVLRLAD